jgi:predicted unusual protein kinase regulating ubiquinone biosynthesis (AarF/ABC1/UbiB family)
MSRARPGPGGYTPRAMASDDDRPPRPTSRVPEGRGERIARLGGMIAGIAGETALEALRRAAGRAESEGSLLLSQANARRVTATLADMRGAAMKLGQMLSLQGEDVLPPEFAEILGGLRNQAHFMPEAQLRTVLADELGPDWEARFAEFDFEPLAAASIGQVHAAVARDGRELALKIQYPGVERSIASDVDNLGVLLRVSRVLPVELDVDPLLEELKRELHLEADYEREAESTERYARLVGEDPGVLVPDVHRDLSTRHVLATDRVHARPIEDLRSPEHPQERRDRVGERLLRLVLRELFEFRFMQTDPNFANYMLDTEKERVALIDFGSVRSFSRTFTERYRAFLIAAVEGARDDLHESGRALGFLRGDEDAPTLTAYADLCRLFTEPLRQPGRYRFAGSDLSRRARDRGLEAASRHRLQQPPPEILFLHRKLVGSFLLCAHVGAEVDCQRIYVEQIRDAS